MPARKLLLNKRAKAAVGTVLLLSAIFSVLTVSGVGWGDNPFDAENVSGPSLSDVNNVLNPSSTFPEDVAVVNGQPIKGLTLAQQVEILRAGGVQGDLTQIALDQLIKHEVLVQAGMDAGLTPSDDDIQTYLKTMQSDLDAVPAGSMERQAIESLAAGAGYDITAIGSSPLLIEWARTTLTAKAMRQKIVADLPDPDKGNLAVEKEAVQKFVDAYKLAGSVEVLLPAVSP